MLMFTILKLLFYPNKKFSFIIIFLTDIFAQHSLEIVLYQTYTWKRKYGIDQEIHMKQQCTVFRRQKELLLRNIKCDVPSEGSIISNFCRTQFY